MSSHQEFEQHPKFTQIVGAAKALFYRFGMKRVSIEEICQQANVSKMTFYKFFPNKLELSKYLLDYIISEGEDEYHAIIKSDHSFPEKITAMIELKRRGLQDVGAEFIADLLKNPEPELAELYRQRSERSLATFMLFLKNAQENGDIRPDIKLEFIAYFLNHLFDMIGDESLRRLYSSPQELVHEMNNFFFYGIMARK